MQAKLILYKSLYTKTAPLVGGKHRCLEPAFPPLHPLHPPKLLLQLQSIHYSQQHTTIYNCLRKIFALLHIYTSTNSINTSLCTTINMYRQNINRTFPLFHCPISPVTSHFHFHFSTVDCSLSLFNFIFRTLIRSVSE